MARMLGYCSVKDEIGLIGHAMRETAAKFDLTEWQAELVASLELFLQRVRLTDYLELCCIDITCTAAVRAAEEVRRHFTATQMLLIAETRLSPTVYLRPAIRASSLLLRPYTQEQARAVLEELFLSMRETERAGQPKMFLLETKQGKSLIPYESISYFEARERKIFLCTSCRQIPFYDTLERLSEELPAQFFRCHKGFIVNCEQIRSISFADSVIELRDGSSVPISRSYKSALKELKI